MTQAAITEATQQEEIGCVQVCASTHHVNTTIGVHPVDLDQPSRTVRTIRTAEQQRFGQRFGLVGSCCQYNPTRWLLLLLILSSSAIAWTTSTPPLLLRLKTTKSTTTRKTRTATRHDKSDTLLMMLPWSSSSSAARWSRQRQFHSLLLPSSGNSITKSIIPWRRRIGILTQQQLRTSSLSLSTTTPLVKSSFPGSGYDKPLVASISTFPQPAVVSDTSMDLDRLDPPLSVPYTSGLIVEGRGRVDNVDDVEVFLQRKGIKSRPNPDGNWKVKDPLGWAKDFGRRSPSTQQRLDALVRLGPGDEGYFPVDKDMKVPRVTIVRTKEQAEIVLKQLFAPDSAKAFHACDTEVMAIDLSNQGPVGNGYVTCVSMYAGPDFDYGLGDGPGTALWIDNLDEACGLIQEFKAWFEDERYLKVWHNYGFDRHVMWNEGINVQGFGGDTMHMARLQNTSRLHYTLESLTAVLLSDNNSQTATPRATGSHKAAAKATTAAAPAAEVKINMKELFGVPKLLKDGSEGKIKEIPNVEVLQRDPTHRVKWIEYSARDARLTWELREKLEKMLKDNSDSKNWVDTDTSWWIEDKTMWDYYWMHMRPFGEVLTDMERRGIRVDAEYLASVEQTARQDRQRHESIFRHWVASLYPPELRAHGLAMNPASASQLQTFLFGGSIIDETGKVTETMRTFSVPRSDIPPEALEAYEQQQLHELEKSTEPSNVITDGDVLSEECQEALNKLEEKLQKSTLVDLKADCKKFGLKVSGKKAILQDRLREHVKKSILQPTGDSTAQKEEDSNTLKQLSDDDLRQALLVRGLLTEGLSRQDMEQRYEDDVKALQGLAREYDSADAIASALDGSLAQYLEAQTTREKPAKRSFDLQVISLYELMKEKIQNGEAKPLNPLKQTVSGSPSVTADVIRELAGDPFADPPKWGKAYGLCGEEGCKALFSLCAIGSIGTMISSFFTTLQKSVDQDSRVHCALNLNTETGRLSSRQPNLQNQPALEKDKYKIRKAFQASPGNSLIVADYGQLELRILACITRCQPMVEAFKLGGDFHSRTALDMYDHIREKVDAGEVLLEWDYSQGKPPKPLLKDAFASERRKAKTLNFSIAYGKTAVGLSQDWGVSRKEAQDIVNKWYDAFQAVGRWQRDTKATAIHCGYTRTLMGRYRHLPKRVGRGYTGSIERAAINTPIQGGAADVVMMAMIKINESQILKDLGWILLLQIHDEVILEGPEETAEEAFEEVVQCMQEPWTYGLNKTEVPLLVDGSYRHKTWYDAK